MSLPVIEDINSEAVPALSSTIFKTFFAGASVALFIFFLSQLVPLTEGVLVQRHQELTFSDIYRSDKIQSPLQSNLLYQPIEINTASELIYKLKEFVN